MAPIYEMSYEELEERLKNRLQPLNQRYFHLYWSKFFIYLNKCIVYIYLSIQFYVMEASCFFHKYSVQKSGEKERTELERLWYLFCNCLDALILSMMTCLALLREFDGNNLVIHTGIDHHPTTHLVAKSTNTVQPGKEVINIDLQCRDRMLLEGASSIEASQLCKYVTKQNNLLLSLKKLFIIFFYNVSSENCSSYGLNLQNSNKR
jgi:hypothetical protein